MYIVVIIWLSKFMPCNIVYSIVFCCSFVVCQKDGMGECAPGILPDARIK